MTNHDLAMMRLAGRDQFDAMTGGNAIQICRRHPGTVKRLAQFARRWLARNRSLAYLMRLWLDDWIERNPVTEGQKDSAWDIYRSMKGLKND